MRDEQREKQLNSLTLSQILKRSIGTRLPQSNDGDSTKSRHGSQSPSPYKIDPFVHHMAPFTFYDKIKVTIYFTFQQSFVRSMHILYIIMKNVKCLIYFIIQFALGTLLILPFRAVMLIFVLVTAWLVAKLGMCGLDQTEIESITISRKGRKYVYFT